MCFNEESNLNLIHKPGFFTKRHIPAEMLEEVLGKKIWTNYFKFGFVRNPWDWFISQHFYNLQANGLDHDIDKPLTPADIISTYNYLKIARGRKWSPSASQHAFLCNEHGFLLVDYLGKFETLEEQFEEVLEILGLTAPLPHLNKSTHRNFKHYYAKETVAIINQLYYPDISLFNYSFDA